MSRRIQGVFLFILIAKATFINLQVLELFMKAVLYVRVSTKEQAKKHSIEAQIKELREYCEKNNLEIFKIYTDNKGGDLFEEREGLMQLLDDKDNYDVLLFTEYDRLSRDPDIKGFVKFELKKAGIKIISINEKEQKSEYDELMEGVINLFARFETKRRLRRLKRGFQIAIDKGVRCHRPPLSEKNPSLHTEVTGLKKAGLSYGSIAKITGLSKAGVYYIINQEGEKSKIIIDKPSFVR